MKQLNVKKLVLLNLPYFLLGLFATNLGEAWRLAVGADASAKMLSFFSTLPVAAGKLVAQPAPAGPGCGPVLRRWPAAGGVSAKARTPRNTATIWSTVQRPLGHRTRTSSPTSIPRVPEQRHSHADGAADDEQPPQETPSTPRNKNVLVIGGSGSGKTRFWLKPNLLQMHSSYVITDPRAPSWWSAAPMLQRGTPKLGNAGRPVKDKHGKSHYEPYQIKVLNTLNFKKSMHYNPFSLHPLAKRTF